MSDNVELNILLVTIRPERWQQLDQNVRTFPVAEQGWQKIPADIAEVDLVVFDNNGADSNRRMIRQLRAEVSSCLIPNYQLVTIDHQTDSISDGVVNDLVEALERAWPIYKRINNLGYDYQTVLTSPLFRILLYMYTRNSGVVPVKDWREADIYVYPVVALLLGFEEQVNDWLLVQTNRGLLEKGELVDRLRRCPNCHLANPSFVDVCPHCRSIHISQEAFLHCFTCGAVKSEVEFQAQAGRLVCPQCSERLRHIGTDYDRPLENFSCRDCGSSFSEPLIVANCSRCGQVTETDELEVKNYRPYFLTEKGRMAAKTGHVDDPSSLMDSLQNVSSRYFDYQVKWLYAMTERYPDEAFTLFGLRVTNFSEIEEKLGVVRLLELVEAYIKRVKSNLRTTDLTCLGDSGDLWVLLPRTDLEGRKIVIDRILQAGSGAISKESHMDLEIFSSLITIPTELQEHDSPDKIHLRMKQDLDLE